MKKSTKFKDTLAKDLANTFLMKRGYETVSRDYASKIDIIATKDGTTHFFDVRTFEMKENGSSKISDQKALNIKIKAYLDDKYKTTDVDWEYSVIAVHIDEVRKVAHVKLISNIIL